MQLVTVNLIKNHNRIIILFVFILFFFGKAHGQFNSEIGYTIGYVPAKITNNILNTYNKTGEVLDPMKDLKYISGFNAGLTFRLKFLKLGLFWESLNTKRNGVKGKLKEGNRVQRNLYFSFNTYSGGTEVLIDRIGVGVTLDYNKFTVKTKTNGVSSKLDVLRDNYYSNKVYLVYYFKATDRFGVLIKPFVQVPWTDISLDKVDDYLDIDKEITFEKENFIKYGLTFSILNGKQP